MIKEQESNTRKALHKVMDSYYKLSNDTWQSICNISTFLTVEKNDYLCRSNEFQTGFYFVGYGLFRVFIVDEKGHEYNKIFFEEHSFPGSMVSLLKNEPSNFEIQALENSSVLHIDFKKYRELLMKTEDLKLFHIFYLEKNWLIDKSSREVSLVQDDAQDRYLEFLEKYPQLSIRLTQYHIASHLGITPTQLSRIRKNILS